MNLPIYNAVITDENDGIYAVSLVDCPATEVDWLAFDKNEKKFEFSLDEVEHCLTAPLMLANTPIYRRNGDFEYYIQYQPETLKVMAEKMLADNTFNNIDFQHNGEIIEKGKVNLLELYIKDENKPSPFNNIPNGSIICTYKINDDNIWESATNGTFNGFSLAGYFNVEEAKFTKEEDNIKNKFMNILDKLKELIVEAEAVEEKPIEVEAADEETNEETEETTEETEETEDEPNALDEVNARIDELFGKFDELKGLIGELTNRLNIVEEELKKPIETPIEEKPEDGEEEKMDKFARIAEILNK